jgi:flagellar motor switch protein FliM
VASTSQVVHSSRPAGRRGGPPQTYDFRRPNKFSRDHVRALQIVSETFARQFSTVLATTLRAVSTATFIEIEQLTYDEYIRSLPNPSHMVILSLHPLPGAAILSMELPMALASVDRMLGGTGEAGVKARPLTEIEANLMRGVVERGLRELDYAFESLVKIESRIMQLESNPQFAQIAAPPDMTIVICFEVKISEQKAKMTLCIPFDSLQPVLETFEAQSMFAGRGSVDPAVFLRQLHESVRDVPVDIHVTFKPVALTSAEVVDLEVGDVVPLHHSVNEPLTISVGNIGCFAGVSGRKGKRLACLVVSALQEPDE